MKAIRIVSLALLAVALLTGCAEEEEERATATATPTAAVVTTPEATPSPEASPVATATPAVTATPAASPTAGLGKLAFVRDGDIWVLDVDSGQERQLTTDGVNREPRWSPDGRWLAFAKAEMGPIWVMREDGSDATLVGESARAGPIWAPSDSRLAYAAGESMLWLVNAESGERRQLSLPDREVSRFAWLPDGKGLVLEMYEPQELEQGLWRINADGTGLVELSTWDRPTSDWVDLGTLSPHGRWLTFWQAIPSASLRADGLPLMIVPATGGEPQQIASATLLKAGFVAWSPQGDRLAVVEGGGRQTWVNKQIVVMRPEGSGRRLLSDAGRADLFPDWSPDGRRIAFTSGEGSQFENAYENYPQILATRHIWVVNGDGSNKRQLTGDPAYADHFPQWSADGAHILFIRQQAEAVGLEEEEIVPVEIWLMKADGSEQRKVVDGVSDRSFGYYGYFPWATLFDWYR